MHIPDTLEQQLEKLIDEEEGKLSEHSSKRKEQKMTKSKILHKKTDYRANKREKQDGVRQAQAQPLRKPTTVATVIR